MVKQRQPDEAQESKEEKSLESMVKDAIESYKANDFKQLSQCVKEIIEHCSSSEDKEENKPEKHSYADQNESAKENE